MDRRDFLTKVPAVVAGVAAGGSLLDAEASSGNPGHEGAPGARTSQGASGAPGAVGFRLLEERARDVPVMLVEDRVPVMGTFPLVEFVVECPYPVGSEEWLVIADGDGRGGVVTYCGEDGVFSLRIRRRRVFFPRFTEGDVARAVGSYDLDERARGVYAWALEHGFDDARGPERGWGVVHVEYRCPDGAEHVLAGLPLEWDPRLALGVMVKGQVGAG